jgi:hypothetical protein
MPFQTENDTVIANAKSYFQFLLQLASPSAVVAFLSIHLSLPCGQNILKQNN